jgi:hypothetical protein
MTYTTYDIGSIVTKNSKDYIVVERNGKKVIERFDTDDWHEDTFHICPPDFVEFAQEVFDGITEHFPEIKLSLEERYDLALMLWQKRPKTTG